MLNARLREIAQRPDAPYVMAFSSTGGFVREIDAFTRAATVKQDSVEKALRTLAEEIRRVEVHGFTQKELDRAIATLIREYEQSAAERDKNDGRMYAAEILRNYFEDEFMPGIEVELTLVKRFAPKFSLVEINGLAKNWGGKNDRSVLISGPAALKAPDKTRVMAVLDDVATSQIAAYDDGRGSGPLMAQKPTPGSVESVKVLSEISAEEWTLSNGVTVVVKPTDFQNDEIRFSAFSPGGTSLVPDADFASTRHAAKIARAGGLGTHSAVALEKLLAGKIASVSSWIGELEEGLNGRGSPRDAETLMQLIHLQFAAPRKDEPAFAAWKASEKELVRNRRLSPEQSFFEDVQAAASTNHLRRRPVTVDSIDAVEYDKALAFYKDRFANANDFTFVFVGNIDKSTFKPLVERYLASLPDTKREESWRDVNVRTPKGIKRLQVQRGVEPKSYYYLTFHGEERYSPEAENNLKALKEILQIRLREVLREELGGVYGASTFEGLERRPKQRYMFGIFFGCDPNNVNKLEKAVMAEIAAIKKSGTSNENVSKILAVRTRKRETDLKENAFWVRKLTEAYRFVEDPANIIDEKLVKQVSRAQLKNAARRYLKKQYLRSVLIPENVATQ
jgi:zinc protease